MKPRLLPSPTRWSSCTIVDAPQDAQPEPEPDFDLAKATADEVITAVANGIITAAAALKPEQPFPPT